ncbi:DUF4064 domain-containing protein [Staphylococcus argenteus]|uniref:DUF4064 domain-containing protein n=1 Tax=Staphylococcus argenteus TaxID=985002 RepID=UPI001EFD35C1|nr:DUF4064 domain-containing protein [Staphylococcus argenteus]MCG9803643.1 DUF4064 domain-containing protein [Staphylococcus argenteus]MCG9810966.1 DUF4064 domain-containing protein [Staphylococcus argenteus]MCG9823705.1 DUF4064 domain-containing protein [Staphylococcus argenteus]
MNRKPELIMSWIANSISIIYFLILGLSYVSLKSGNATQREELAKQLSKNGGNVSLDMLTTSIGVLAIILLLSTLYGIFATICIKARRKLAISLFVFAVIISFIAINLLAIILWIVVIFMLISKKEQTEKSYTEKRHKDDEYIYH